ncbi:probable helicase CHR10 isoform X4 [Aristolochia californica]|uniref:probable helicase CHR10 isoform X4 n=1 Tax=Aristolochia californica TaxID=171875 RepID=UPI0035E05691
MLKLLSQQSVFIISFCKMNYEQRLRTAAQFVLSNDGVDAKYPPLNCAEIGVLAALKPHQIEGVSWLIHRYLLGVNVILGDEMGLGKTLQAITLLTYLKVHKISPGPFLVLCPLSVTDGWMSEFTKFVPALRVLRYVGDKGVRLAPRRTIYEHVKHQESPSCVHRNLPFDVLLTTYDIVLLDQDFLSQIPWHYAVLDEAQRLKNPSSVLYNVLEERFVMPRRLLMTGTPIQNNLSELWALMHFCLPSIFGTLELFVSAFKEDGYSCLDDDDAKVKERFKTLKYILRAFMLRRTKSMLVESGTLMLPPLTEITVMVPLVPLQKKVYVSILRRELPELLAISSGASSHQSLQNIVIQLRKACSHPYIFNGIEPEPYKEGEHIVEASGKLVVLDQLLKKLHAAGHRVLLFAQMTHILQDFLELRGHTYERLDGSIRAEERFAAIRSFSQKPAKDILGTGANQEAAFVFMISTRAGGVGLNLVAADTVIFYEQDWNPQVDKQALQRTHRIGQINHVLCINLVSAHTVEEVIMRRAERKLQLSHCVIGEDYHKGKEMGADAGDLRSLILGLHLFDPSDINDKDSSVANIMEVESLSEKVIQMRDHDPSVKDDRKFEINEMDSLHGTDFSVKKTSDFTTADPGLDELSYQSWINKFKEASKSMDFSNVEFGRKRDLAESKPPRREVDRSKTEEKKLAKWEALGYQSLAIKDPIPVMGDDILSNSGSVQFVYGDCTKPLNTSPSEPSIIFSCIDNSGKWGHGGMFDALKNLSGTIPAAYQRAFECGDLHLGDLHLIKINEADDKENKAGNGPQWVALAIVQSYNPRRKVPRSSISVPDIEQCILKASYVASQNSASIHMPRIGYQDGTDRSEWYRVERLLRKYASIYSIKIFVYYYRRPS